MQPYEGIIGRWFNSWPVYPRSRGHQVVVVGCTHSKKRKRKCLNLNWSCFFFGGGRARWTHPTHPFQVIFLRKDIHGYYLHPSIHSVSEWKPRRKPWIFIVFDTSSPGDDGHAKNQTKFQNSSEIPSKSTQIIATSHDLTWNGGLVRGLGLPLFQGNLGWWNIVIRSDQILSPEAMVIIYAFNPPAV